MFTLTEEQQKEFDKYEKRLVGKVARANYADSFLKMHVLDYDDVEQFARLGLIKGIQTFDPTKNNKKSSFYIRSMRWEIGKSIREYSLRTTTKNNAQAEELASLDVAFEVGDMSIVHDYQLLHKENSDVPDINWERLKKIDPNLPMVILELSKGNTLAEIETDCGWPRHRAARLVRRNKKQIAECLRKDGLL